MELQKALSWAAQRSSGVLITLRRDGRAQSSDIAYAMIDGLPTISVTADRAKTANMRRDPRVVLHISEPSSYSYLSIDATATLTPVTEDPHDATADLLVEYYESLRGPHPDWEEYRAAMVADRRLVAVLGPQSVVGLING